MDTFVVYANISIVVPIEIFATSADEALKKGEQIFNKMTEDEILSVGIIGAPLDGVFCVKNLKDEVILEKM